MTPSVGPFSSCRRHHSMPNSTAPLSSSSTTGAPNVATTYQPSSSPVSSVSVSSDSPSVFRMLANSAATPAPQRNANSRALGGSGSSRSSASTSGSQTATGSTASSSPTTNE